MKIHNRVAIGLIAGVVLGAVWGPGASVLEPMGTIFIKLIRMMALEQKKQNGKMKVII